MIISDGRSFMWFSKKRLCRRDPEKKSINYHVGPTTDPHCHTRNDPNGCNSANKRNSFLYPERSLPKLEIYSPLKDALELKTHTQQVCGWVSKKITPRLTVPFFRTKLCMHLLPVPSTETLFDIKIHLNTRTGPARSYQNIIFWFPFHRLFQRNPT